MPYWTRLLAVCCAGVGPAFLAGATVVHAGWQLTFSDEFDGDTLDLRKWKLSDRWGNGTLAGNGEQQCYVPEGVTQSGGMLLLTARRAVTRASQCHGATADLQFTSGRATTSGCNQGDTSEACRGLEAFHQAYGYFEVRARLPNGKGFWPAFWLVPMDSSWPPEIDVMEALGHMPSTVYHTYHYHGPAGKHDRAGKAYDGQDFTAGFSTFGVDWQPGLLIWYVNGRETYRFASPYVTAKSMYLQVNLAVGGYWPGNPDTGTPFPSRMEIDYVRVYKRVSDGTPDDLPPMQGSNGTK